MSYKVIVDYYKGKSKGNRITYDNIELKEILEVIERARLEHPKDARIYVGYSGYLLFAQDFIEGMHNYRMS